MNDNCSYFFSPIFPRFPENSSIDYKTNGRKRKKKLEIKIAIISIIVLFFFFCRSKNRAGHRSIERMVTFFPYNDKKETMRDEEDEKNRGETRSECNTSFRGGDRNWNGNDIQ